MSGTAERARVSAEEWIARAAAISPRTERRAHRLARGIRAGTVLINTFDTADITIPFGGVKQSGSRRDKGWPLSTVTSSSRRPGWICQVTDRSSPPAGILAARSHATRFRLRDAPEGRSAPKSGGFARPAHRIGVLGVRLVAYARPTRIAG
jgi:hypothetical protein